MPVAEGFGKTIESRLDSMDSNHILGGYPIYLRVAPFVVCGYATRVMLHFVVIHLKYKNKYNFTQLFQKMIN